MFDKHSHEGGEQQAALAQLAERSLSKRKVIGSNPICG